MAKPNAREDWFIRWIALSDIPTTEDVLAARQAMDSSENKSKTLSTLKKLEKAGWLTSQKVGRELAWTTTEAGRKVMA